MRLSCAAFLVAAMSLGAVSAAAEDLSLRKKPLPLPEFTFTNGAGTPQTLKAWRGRFVLLNLWATWCGPCRAEMPALNRLQAKLGSAKFEVLALSVDRSGIETVREFFAEFNIAHLGLFHDATGGAAKKLGILALPGTILVDPQGRELGRYVGAVEWDAPEIVAFLQMIMDDDLEGDANENVQKTNG